MFSLKASEGITYSPVLPSILAANYKNLRRVFLSEQAVNADAVVDMVKSCQQLTHIDVAVNDRSCCAAIAEHCPNLQSLQLRNVPVPGSAIAYLATNCQELHTLRVSCCEQSDMALEILSTQFPNLHSIELHAWTAWSVPALASFLTCKTLREVSLNLATLTESQVELLLSAMVSGSPQISSLYLLGTFRNLRFDIIERLGNLQDVHFSNQYFWNIGFNVPSIDLKTTWASFSRLQKLTLNSFTNFDDAALQALVQHCTLLQELHLSGATVTDAGLQYLGQHAHSLKSLTLLCPSTFLLVTTVTMPVLWAMAETCKSLRYINVTMWNCKPRVDHKGFPARVYAVLTKPW